VIDTRADASDARNRFVEASRRMALALRRPPPAVSSVDPGVTLIGLLGFADAVAAGQPGRPVGPLEFPPLTRLSAAASGAALAH
jgi:hypothetical protein